jgi:dTDP-glucose pyrophosphorylase
MYTKVSVTNIRERMKAAQAQLEVASLYVMYPEVRTALNAAKVELRVALELAQGAR